MRPVITPEEAARLDETSEVPVQTLMERAGLGVALAAVEAGARYGTRVLVLAGPGNNGGDGYVAARHLKHRGVDVEVRSLGFPKGDDAPARVAGAAAVGAGVRVRPLGAPEPADLIIDALFGVGFHGELPDVLVPWTEHPAPVVAVDLPSGLDGYDGGVEGAVFTAARTVTFDAAKVGHFVGKGPDHIGELKVIPIGLPAPRAAYYLTDVQDAPVPARSPVAHKWSVGSVAVVGGSAGLVGAAVMAGDAAVRFGAGAVRLIVPNAVRAEAAAGHPGLMTSGIGDSEVFEATDVSRVLEAVARFDVLVVGPGLGGVAPAFVEGILDQWDRPLVADADGLGVVSLDALARRTAPTVITPHQGEFERLVGEPAHPGAAFALAEDIGCVVLLKGPTSFVGGRERWAIDSGGPELATIGTGDVLAGMVGALIGRGLSPEVAARSAAYRHGRAGSDLASITSVTATGLLDAIGRWAN